MTVVLNNNENKNENENDVKTLIEKNIELSNEILRLSKKTRSILMWQSVFGFLKVILILIPLILGFIYLPPILEEVLKSYQEALGIGGNSVETETDNIKNAPKNFFESLIN